MAVTGAATLAPCDGFFVPALSLYALLCASDTLINDICSVNVNFINSRNFHARRVASPPKTCLAWPKQNADASNKVTAAGATATGQWQRDNGNCYFDSDRGFCRHSCCYCWCYCCCSCCCSCTFFMTLLRLINVRANTPHSNH